MKEVPNAFKCSTLPPSAEVLATDTARCALQQRRMPVAWLFAVTMLLFATNFASLAVAEDLDGQQVGIDVSNRLAENLFESVGEQAGTAVAEKLGEGMGDLLGGPIGGGKQ